MLEIVCVACESLMVCVLESLRAQQSDVLRAGN